MKRGYKRLLIFELFIIVFFILSSFVSNILGNYTKVLVLVISLLLFRIFFGFEKDKRRYTKLIIIETIIFLLIYFLIYYLSGILITFAKTYYSFKAIYITIIPLILVIIFKEFFRFQMLNKAEDNKFLTIMTVLLFVFIDVVGYIKLSAFQSNLSTFVFIAIVLLPAISSNILCSYMSYNASYKTSIFYLLVMNLYRYILPIIPNPNEYIYAIIEIVVPIIFLYRVYKFFKNEQDEKIVRDYNKKRINSLILPTLLIVFIVYITSGYFKYYALVIGSGSMTPNIKKGDVVIVEKVDDVNNIAENEVIAYRYNNIIVVHRLKKKIYTGSEYYFYTKGDANNSLDSYKITSDMIIGIVKIKIPYIGYPTVWLNEL